MTISERHSVLNSPSIHSDSDNLSSIAQPLAGEIHSRESQSGIWSFSAELLRRYRTLIGGLLSLGLFTVICISAYKSRTSPISGIAHFWLFIAMSLTLFGGVRLIWQFIDQVRRGYLFTVDSNAAIICTVEVCIANETVLTVRSWWPMHMSRRDVEKHGVRVAMSSANRWISENSNPGGKITRVRFTEQTAVELCNNYTCSSIEHGCGNQCSVCLEDVEAGCVEMKKCGHIFHSECLSSWFAQSSKLVCPMCRTDHHSLVPQSIYMQHVIKENPTVSVLSVSLEEGTLCT